MMYDDFETRQDDLTLRCVVTGEIAENCYVLFRDGRADCVVVDPGDDAQAIRSAADGREIAAILLTHGHFDHIGAVDQLMGAQTRLLIHSLDQCMLSDPHRNASWLMGKALRISAHAETFEDREKLTLAGIGFDVIHTLGHSPGSVCFRVGRWMLTGDTVMSSGMGIGRCDLPGGDEAAMQASLRRLIPLLQGCLILGGHGENSEEVFQNV